MSDYDRWLEKPYTDAAKLEADFERWCEENDRDPDEPGAYDEFEAALEEQEY